MRSSVMIPRAFFSGMERSLPEGTLDRRDEAEERRDDLDAAAGRATVETAFVRVVLPSAVRVAVEDLVRDLVSDMPPERVDRRAVPSIAGAGHARRQSTTIPRRGVTRDEASTGVRTSRVDEAVERDETRANVCRSLEVGARGCVHSVRAGPPSRV